MTQYADDTYFFIEASERSCLNLLSQINIFSTISGLNVNLEISFLLGIGIFCGFTIPFHGFSDEINWIHNEDFKLVGIIYNTNLSSMVHYNYDIAMLKLQHLTNVWSRLNLTVLGRITILKSIILLSFNYYMLTLPSPEGSFIRKSDSLCFNFKNKPDRISTKKIVRNYSDGKIKMIDISTHVLALKTTCVTCLLRNGNKNFA